MNWLDIIIIVMLAVTTLMGLSRGLIGTVIPLVGIILGIVVAGHCYGSMAEWLSTWLESTSQAEIVGYLIIFALVVTAMLVVARMVSKLLDIMLMGWVDSVGGAAFGLIVGGVVAGALLTIIAKFFPSHVEGTFQDSALASFLLDKFPMVLYILPPQFDSVREFFT